MSISIELTFDRSSSNALRDVWLRVETVGKGRRLSQSPSAPHISLALFDEEQRNNLSSVVERLATTNSVFDLAFTNAAAFDSLEGVIYLVPSSVDALETCHTRLHDELARFRLESNPLYGPGRWIPHCTVGVGVESEHRDLAISAATQMAPPSVEVCFLRVFHYGLGRALAEYELRAA